METAKGMIQNFLHMVERWTFSHLLYFNITRIAQPDTQMMNKNGLTDNVNQAFTESHNIWYWHNHTGMVSYQMEGEFTMSDAVNHPSYL